MIKTKVPWGVFHRVAMSSRRWPLEMKRGTPTHSGVKSSGLCCTYIFAGFIALLMAWSPENFTAQKSVISLGTFFLGELSQPVHENNWICGASFRVFPSPQRVSVATTKNGGVLCGPRNNALKEGPPSIWVLPTFLCMNPNLRPPNI